MRSSRKALRTYIPGLVLAALLGGAPLQAAAPAAGPDAAVADTPVSSVHIDNFGRVNEHYYRGAQPKGDDFKALSNVGVKLMIDLASEGDPREEANARAAGMRFVRIPMNTHQA